MERLLRANALLDAFDVAHLDIADRRDLANLGQLDARNVWLGVRHAAELKYLLLRHRPDVVYFEVSQNAWAFLRDSQFMLLPRLVGAKVATRLNGSDFRNFHDAAHPLLRRWMQLTLRRLDGVAVLGESLRGLFDGLVAPDRIGVVPNGTADLFSERAGPQPADRRASAGEPLTVLYLGALYKPKGILDFLEAARLMRAAGSRARFVAAGAWFDAATRREAESKIDADGSRSAVELPGVVAGDAKRELLMRSDVLVFPGVQNEGQPYVILEAMAASLPVVSTARGAIEDMVVNERTGFIVPIRDPGAIAGALRRLEVDPAARRALGRAGRERYLDRFTDEVTIQQLVDWLRNVAGRDVPGSAMGAA